MTRQIPLSEACEFIDKVIGQDASQQRFVENRMSTMLEPTPLLPNVGR